MLRNCIHLYKYLQLNPNLAVLAHLSSKPTKEKWDLVTSVCIERKPVITPILNEIESEFQEYLNRVEFERSLKSDHEIRHENDLKQLAMLKNLEMSNKNADLDGPAIQTAQDFEDACVDELAKFQFANRITVSDEKYDSKSLERKLDKYLVLLTKQKIGTKYYFLLPQGIRQEGETLRQTAERVLNESCGNGIKVQVLGNAPIGFYKYKYPKDVQKNGTVGAKIFIYFAQYQKGNITNDTNDFKWLDRLELSKELPFDYYKSLSKCLIDN